MQPDDQYWRRPDDAAWRAVPAHESPPYHGPPQSSVPPADWRPPSLIEPAAPRTLPPQDHGRIDEDEARAVTLTHGIALVVGGILVVLLCAVCARTLF